MISFFKKGLFEQISQNLEILLLYCFKVYRCIKKTHVKTYEKKAGKRKQNFQKFCQIIK